MHFRCDTLFEPDSNEIGCNRCTRWFHQSCSGLESWELEDIEAAYFECDFCE